MHVFVHTFALTCVRTYVLRQTRWSISRSSEKRKRGNTHTHTHTLSSLFSLVLISHHLLITYFFMTFLQFILFVFPLVFFFIYYYLNFFTSSLHFSYHFSIFFFISFQTVMYDCVRNALKKTGTDPKSIDILVINCSLFSPTPSLCSMVSYIILFHLILFCCALFCFSSFHGQIF